MASSGGRQLGESKTRYTMQQVLQWNEHRVCQWVREQGFGKYENAFRENVVTGEALVELDYGLLKELSVRTVGERVRLNLAIRQLRQQCLQLDISEVSGRSKRSATIDGMANSPSAFSAGMVISPGPMSTSTSASTAVALDTANSTFGFKKGLPILPRGSMSSNSIGLGDLESAGNGAGIAGNFRNNGNLMQRANTDMRSFSLHDRDSPAHNMAGATIRKPKPAHIGSPNLTSVTNELAQRFADSGTTSQQAALSLKTGTGIVNGFEAASEPMSAPVQRLRMMANAHRAQQQQKSPTQASSKPNQQTIEQAEEIERLGFQLQDFFGSGISVAHLADSLSMRTWQVAVTGPENQVRHVSISNTTSARVILDRVRRAFDLDNDVDNDQYSLFSMTSEGGGARCLSSDELVKMFSDPNKNPPEKFYLRKRHHLPRPPIGTKRSEHLQRAIERLGNILPTSSASSQAQQQPIMQRSISKWESTTEKLTKILGERPPSELVSMNVEKYFPGNEARARHSVMRRRKNESMEAAGLDGLDSSLGRSSRRQSRAHRRSSNTSARVMQARIRSVTTASDDRSSAFSNSLGPIEESLTSPPQLNIAVAPPVPAIPANIASASPLPSVSKNTGTPPAAQQVLPETGSLQSVDALNNKESETDTKDRPSSKMIASSPQTPSRSCASLQFSDEDSRVESDVNNMRTLSDLSLSDAMDSDCSSFYSSLSDSDIDADLADCDSDTHQSTADAVLATDMAPAEERRQSVARSTSTKSRAVRAHVKKTWIKGALIASGSFGSVYFGMNTRTGAIMAVKEVDPPQPGTTSVVRNQRMADALRHELDLLKGLDHKNVVKYLGTDMDDTKLYIFLEYVSGGSVSSALASYGMFPETLVRTYTAQIIKGLVYLHGQGIIHRDIKGGNVLIDQDGSVKISDFGISKRVDDVVTAAATKQRRASLQGSVFWMAPEVVKDTHYTVKGDVWSLGCLVIEMLTGNHP
ncbi:ATP binding, partial [Coemansia sp. RSA 518]